MATITVSLIGVTFVLALDTDGVDMSEPVASMATLEFNAVVCRSGPEVVVDGATFAVVGVNVVGFAVVRVVTGNGLEASLTVVLAGVLEVADSGEGDAIVVGTTLLAAGSNGWFLFTTSARVLSKASMSRLSSFRKSSWAVKESIMTKGPVK